MTPDRDAEALERAVDEQLEEILGEMRSWSGTEAQTKAVEARLLAKIGRSGFAKAGLVKSSSGWLHILITFTTATALVHPDLGRATVSEHAAREGSAPAATAFTETLAPQAPLPDINTVPAAAPEAPAQPRPEHRDRKEPAAKPATPVRPRPPTRDPRAEIDLLLRARDALARDPDEALRLVDQHASRFPHGMFAQEREALAVEVLTRAHAKQAALERAKRFVRDNGRSVYGRGLRNMVDQSVAQDVDPSTAEADPRPVPRAR